MDATNATIANEETGDSWIFVAESQSVNYGNQDVCPENRENQTEESDTDSISIIGEGDSEEHNELHAEDTDQFVESASTDQTINARSLQPPCDEEQSQRDSQEELIADIDLSSSNIKTYVHRNNNNLNTMLNIILLGSVLIATGLAIGHMWGVQDDCTLHANTSITEVLYTLNKLQVENQFLKKKVTEMEKMYLNTMTTDIPEHIVQQKWTIDQVEVRHPDLKIVTEKDKWKHIDDPTVISQMRKSLLQDDFEEQINRFNSIYSENKEWLDKEVVNRLRKEDQVLKLTHSTVTDDGRIVPLKRRTNSDKPNKTPLNGGLKIYSTQTEEHKMNDNIVDNENIFTAAFTGPLSLNDYSKQDKARKKENINLSQHSLDNVILKTTTGDKVQEEKNPEKKLYSDALKNTKKRQQTSSGQGKSKINMDNRMPIEDSFIVDQKVAKRQVTRDQKWKNNKDKKAMQKKIIKSYDSDDDIIVRDCKFMNQKHTYGRKKNDRQKSSWKTKNQNKYQQWEMNRGYLNNEAGISVESFDELPKYSDESHFTQERNMNQYTDDLIKKADSYRESRSVADESEFNIYKTKMPKRSKEYFRRVLPSNGDWYSKLASGRNEMRNRKFLPQNKAQWYFQRMDDREHCRRQMKNVTKQCPNVRTIKKSMNYKTKR